MSSQEVIQLLHMGLTKGKDRTQWFLNLFWSSPISPFVELLSVAVPPHSSSRVTAQRCALCLPRLPEWY